MSAHFRLEYLHCLIMYSTSYLLELFDMIVMNDLYFFDRLWHQLTLKLLEFVKNPMFSQGDGLVKVLL